MTLRDLFPCLNDTKPKNQPLDEKVSDDEDGDDERGDNVLDGSFFFVSLYFTTTAHFITQS